MNSYFILKRVVLLSSLQNTSTNRESNRVLLMLLINLLKCLLKKSKVKFFSINNRFRKDFISQLWRDTSNIKFIRQLVGHAKISKISTT